MRDTIAVVDRHLYYCLVLNTCHTIYTVMLNIYVISLMAKSPQMWVYIQLLALSSVSSSVSTIISCFICGRVSDKSRKLHVVLDHLNARDMTDREFREWLTFATVMRNTRTFGFTIGGFAALNKSTLIEVCIEINFYIKNIFYFLFITQIFSFILYYTVILLQTRTT
jgi:hypothetical protein